MSLNFDVGGRRYRASLIVCPRQRGYGKQAQRGLMVALHPLFVRFVPLGRWRPYEDLFPPK